MKYSRMKFMTVMTRDIMIDSQNYEEDVWALFKPYVMAKDKQINKNEIE